MSDIQKLLNKYYKAEGQNMTATPKRHPQEQTTNTYDKQQKREHNQRKRQAILTELLQETPFRLNPAQTTQIRYWINLFNKNWKNLHRQASNETIILAMIMLQRKQTNPQLKVERFAISQKYNLTYPIYTTIIGNIVFELMRTTPLQYNQKIYLDNHIEDKKSR